jgi:molybdopterin converting factor small subunit
MGVVLSLANAGLLLGATLPKWGSVSVALGDYERTMSVALNTDYSRMTAAVQDGDEVAFLPPVSGG